VGLRLRSSNFTYSRRSSLEAFIHQLEKELKHLAEELDRSTPQPGTERPLQECRKEVDFLRRELVLLPTLIGNDGVLQWLHRFWVSGVPETNPADTNRFEILVSAAGFEPATHALKGLVRPKINNLEEVGDSSTE
jgi:hypothetical protein